MGESLMAVGRKTPWGFLSSWNTMKNVISINNRFKIMEIYFKNHSQSVSHLSNILIPCVLLNYNQDTHKKIESGHDWKTWS